MPARRHDYSDEERTELSARPAWAQPRAWFLGSPRLTKLSNAKDLTPTLFTSCAEAPDSPFLAEEHPGQYTLRRSTDGSPYYTVLSGGVPVASYEGQTLVVDKRHRRRGLALELVITLRSEHPGLPPSSHRTAPAQALQERAHEEIVRRALLRGESVPPAVLDDYPALRRLAKAVSARREDAASSLTETNIEVRGTRPSKAR